jgi:hypothetical protein
MFNSELKEIGTLIGQTTENKIRNTILLRCINITPMKI